VLEFESQLLGVPILPTGTGQDEAIAILIYLKKWGVICRVAALCFNNTGSDTGPHSGTCTIIN